MTGACGVCGGELDALAITVTLQFAPGPHGTRSYRSVPWRLENWPVCWGCVSGVRGEALRRALEDEYMEPVIAGPPPAACHAVCAGTFHHGRGRIRQFFSIRAGGRGEPESWARCPVCLGPCEVERAA